MKEINTNVMETVLSTQLSPEQRSGQCSICLDLLDTQEVLSKTDCNHYFHPDCLHPWVTSKRTCPLCRAPACLVSAPTPPPVDTTLYIPLPFFYSRDSGVALPVAALPYNNTEIQFSFRNWEEVVSFSV
jgi:hypothetical protein